MTDRYEEHRLGDANLIRCRDCRALVLDVDVHDAHHEGDALCGLPWDSLLDAHNCEYPAGHSGPHQCACGEHIDGLDDAGKMGS